MAITLKNKNFAYSKLLNGIAHDATSLQVSSGEGARFPSTGPFRAVIWSGALSSPLLDLSREIVTMELVSGDVFTITRAQEGTGARSWLASDNIAHVVTAGKLDEIEGEILSNGSDISVLQTAVTDLQNTRLKLDGTNSMSVADQGGLRIYSSGTINIQGDPSGGGAINIRNNSDTGLYLDGPDVILPYGSLYIPNNKAIYLLGNGENYAYIYNNATNYLTITSGKNGLYLCDNAGSWAILINSLKETWFSHTVALLNNKYLCFSANSGGSAFAFMSLANELCFVNGSGGLKIFNNAFIDANIVMTDAGEFDVKRADLKVSSGNIHVSPSTTEAPLVIGANGQGQLVTGLNADQWEGLHSQDLLDLICPNFIEGFTLSNNASDTNNDIDFAPGRASVDDSSHRYVVKTTSTMTKRLDESWAAGTDQGGLFSGSKAASTWYHCFVIRKDSDGSVDFGFDTSVTAANKPSGYSAYRRILSIRTDSSGNIMRFAQVRDHVLWKDPPCDCYTVNPGTDAVLQTLTVPTGVQVLADFNWFAYFPNAARNIYFTCPDQDDEVGNFNADPIADFYSLGGAAMQSAGRRVIRTNTSAQIRYRQTDANASAAVGLGTNGWVDPRGRT